MLIVGAVGVGGALVVQNLVVTPDEINKESKYPVSYTHLCRSGAVQENVREYIKKIEVFAPDKSSGKRRQKIKIYFNFVDEVDIPVFSEPSIAESTYGRRKTA